MDREATELELKQLRSERDAAQALAGARSDLIAHVSHEMRAPLSGILGMAQLLLESELDTEHREYTELINRSGEALLTLVNDILDHAKIEAGKLTIDAVAFDLAHAVSETVKTLELTATERGLTLSMEASPDLPAMVVGDPGRIRQVLFNLIGNAIKFTHVGGITVKVDAEAISPDRVILRFAVADTGIGMTPDQAEAIFQPFEQADAAVFKQYGGTGLGLAISRRLAELMRGRMWVDSVKGSGSTFFFTVEVSTEAGAEHTESGLPAAREDLDVVLITDTRRRVVAKGLEGANVRTIKVAATGRAADSLAAALADRPAHIVVSDFRDEGLDGAEAVLGAATDARVIVLTPGGQRGDAARCRRLGISAYLTGSVTSRDVSRAVDAIVEGVPALITRHWLRERRAYK